MISCELRVNTAGIESVRREARTPMPSELGAFKTRSLFVLLNHRLLIEAQNMEIRMP